MYMGLLIIRNISLCFLVPKIGTKTTNISCKVVEVSAILQLNVREIRLI